MAFTPLRRGARRPILTASFVSALALIALCAPAAPAMASDQDAGAAPIADPAVLSAFGGAEGVKALTAAVVERYAADPVIGDFFRATDKPRLAERLYEQFCYILGGACHYSGRDMRAAHADMGVQERDLNRLVQLLEVEMDARHIPFWAQAKLLARLAPMRRDVVTR
jgi:hemoglobin